MTSRPRAGQAQGGELVALAMAAALVFFVGREAIRTSRDTAVRRHPVGAATMDSGPGQDSAAPAVRAVRIDSLALQHAPTRPRIDRAELRRRIEVGAPGTYIGDMLADRDSLLTRWPERTMDPVRVWIQRSATFPDWTPELFRVARAAFDEWGEVGIPIRFTFTIDSTRADIRVSFADRIADRNRLGVTTHRHDPDGWIVGADILIATHDTTGVALAPPLIAAIARHEVGHALGLAHSRDRATIMYPESETMSITGPDRATMKLLYTLPPGSVR
jgi:hypothetical protein